MALCFIIITLKLILYQCHWDYLVVSKKAQVHVVKLRWLNSNAVDTADSENEEYSPDMT